MPAVVYGTPEQVASMAGVFTTNGEFVDPVPASPGPYVKGTVPTLTEVNDWLVSVTGMMNLALGSRSFVYPIDETLSPNAFSAVSLYVSQLVADLVAYRNSRGRFLSDRVIEKSMNPMAIIARDLDAWVLENERGLIADHVQQIIVPLAKNFPRMRVLGRFPSGSAGTPRDI